MTALIQGTDSYFMGAQAFLLDDDREVASDWASKHIQHNPAIKWVLGRFVEANNPNNNMQAWSLEDLRISRPTINNAPMNLLHQARNIVGTFVANELIYPTDATGTEAAYSGVNNPYVEVLGAYWKYYFPDELELVQRAHDEGSLFFSMECVAETITFEDLVSGETQEFPYKGPRSETYGDWNKASTAIRWLNKPHFLGGALILPPSKPGWNKADIKALAAYVEEHQEVAEQLYDSVQQQAPHLSAQQIEDITLGLLSGQITEEMNDLVKNSNTTDHLSMIGTSDNSDKTVSEVSHPEGGEMSTESKTYTEDELNAAVEAAVKAALEPVNAELEQYRTQAADDAVEARLENAKAEYEAKIEEIQQALDAAVIEAQTAKEERDAFVAWLEGEAAAAEEAAVRAEREEARLAQIKEVANFPEEFVASQTERWVAMSDEDFEATVASYKAVADAAKSEKEEAHEGENLLGATAMTASHDEDEGKVELATRRGIMVAARQGQKFDPRTV